MCGIFGQVGRVDHREMMMLAYMNMERGKDSGGFFNGRSWVKQIGPITHLIKEAREDWKAGTQVLLGHTRMATHGVISGKNAHPFHFDHIIGAHNGILSNWKQIEQQEKTKFEVDSEAIFYLLAHHAMSRITELEGSLGAWWYDLKTKEVHLVSHMQTLSYVVLPERFVFSSDFFHLQQIYPDEKIQDVRDDEHVTIKEDGSFTVEEMPWPKPLRQYYGTQYDKTAGKACSYFCPTCLKTVEGDTLELRGKKVYCTCGKRLRTKHLTVLNKEPKTYCNICQSYGEVFYSKANVASCENCGATLYHADIY